VPTSVETSIDWRRGKPSAWIDYDRGLSGYPGRLTFTGGMDGLTRAEVVVTVAVRGEEAKPVASRVVLENDEDGVTQRAAAEWTARLTRTAIARLTGRNLVGESGEQTVCPWTDLGVGWDEVRWLMSRSSWARAAGKRRNLVDYGVVLATFNAAAGTGASFDASKGYDAVQGLDFCTDRGHARVLVHRAQKQAGKGDV